jgi:D-glycero-D-manno-heptose 1,7-bisphosphate phosphatase
MSAAVFLDRDGTLVEARHYPTRPEELVLYDGLADELRVVQQAGFRLVLITNQSGLARGYFDWAQLERMHEALLETMRSHEVAIDGIYVCPHHPEGTIGELAIECECRKPKPGMLLRAAQDLDLDLSRSWFIGDILDDVEAGNRAGCRTVLVDLGTERSPESPLRTPTYVARDTVHAVRLVQVATGMQTDADFTYRPPRWSDIPVPAHNG